jgi:hypothetical protein
MANNEKSDKEKEFEKAQEIQMNLLRSNASLTAANTLKGEYGKEGETTASQIFRSQEVFELKNQLQEQKKREYEEQGINYEPPEVQNVEALEYSNRVTKEALSTLTLGNLEKVAKEFMPNLALKVPEQFKKETGISITEKLRNNNQDEKARDMYACFEISNQAYSKGSAMAYLQQTNVNSLNEAAKQINEKYSKAA